MQKGAVLRGNRYPAIYEGQSLKMKEGVAIREQLIVVHLAMPKRIEVDNGTKGFIITGRICTSLNRLNLLTTA